MTGQELKARIMEVGKSQKDIADYLGVTAQSLSSVLSAKDVRSGTIEKIAQVLNVPISFLYGEKDKDQSAVASGHGIAVAGNNNVAGSNVTMCDNAVLQERIKFLEQQVKDKESIIDEKERLIKVLLEK